LPAAANFCEAFLRGLADFWPKILPCVLSFGVLGLRGLANAEVRASAEFVNREYVNWWLLYLLLITCVPFTTIVVGRSAHFAPALSFVNLLWALALNFAAPLLNKWGGTAALPD
jgi:uncharacterized membrane protein